MKRMPRNVALKIRTGKDDEHGSETTPLLASKANLNEDELTTEAANDSS